MFLFDKKCNGIKKIIFFFIKSNKKINFFVTLRFKNKDIIKKNEIFFDAKKLVTFDISNVRQKMKWLKPFISKKKELFFRTD